MFLIYFQALIPDLNLYHLIKCIVSTNLIYIFFRYGDFIINILYTYICLMHVVEMSTEFIPFKLLSSAQSRQLCAELQLKFSNLFFGLSRKTNGPNFSAINYLLPMQFAMLEVMAVVFIVQFHFRYQVHKMVTANCDFRPLQYCTHAELTFSRWTFKQTSIGSSVKLSPTAVLDLGATSTTYWL